MPSWDPELYLRFAGERTQPAIDLVARISKERPRRIVDLGCGPGNATEVLRARWPDAEIVGVDVDPAMIAAARASYPDSRWELADVSKWTPEEPFDVVFSNAALQWLPDHAALLPRLLKAVAPGGVLAVQMPAVSESLVHLAVRSVSTEPRWSERLESARNASNMRRPVFYYDVLRPLVATLAQWETEYLHPLEGPDAVIEWVRGTALRPYLEALRDEVERSDFIGKVRARIQDAWTRTSDGHVLLPYRRQFFVASI